MSKCVCMCVHMEVREREGSAFDLVSNSGRIDSFTILNRRCIAVKLLEDAIVSNFFIGIESDPSSIDKNAVLLS